MGGRNSGKRRDRITPAPLACPSLPGELNVVARVGVDLRDKRA